MDAAKKADGLAELAAFLDEPKRVSVDGTEYDLAKLRPIDLAEARNWIVKKRSEHLLETFRNTPIDPASFGAALAAIECTPLSVFEVTHHASGRLKLIHLSLMRAGGTMTFRELERNLEQLSQDKLYAYCMWISGCLDSPEPEKGDDGAPFIDPSRYDILRPVKEMDWVVTCGMIAKHTNEKLTDVMRWPIPAVLVYLGKLPEIAKDG